MNPLSRNKVIYNGILKKGEKNILEVGNEKYYISDYLRIRIQIKKWALSVLTLLLTFVYFFSLEKFQDIPFEGINEQFKEALSITALYLFTLVSIFFLLSYTLIPKNLSKHSKKIYD